MGEAQGKRSATFAVLYKGLECETKSQSVSIRVLLQSSIVYAPLIHRFLVVFLQVDRNNYFIIDSIIARSDYSIIFTRFLFQFEKK